MDINELKSKFLQHRAYCTEDVNELLDFAKKSYIFNEISIIDYRSLVFHLESQGAQAIEMFQDNSFTGSRFQNK